MSLGLNLLRSSATRTAHAIAASVVAFFMMPFFVANLGEHWYGIWVVLSGLAGNYYLLDLGLAAAVTTFVSRRVAKRDHQGVNTVVNTSACLYTLLGGIILGITLVMLTLVGRFLANPSETGVVRTVMFLVGLEIAIEFPFKSLAGIVAAYVRYDLLIYSRIIHLTLSTSLNYYLVSHGGGILSLAVTSLTCSLIAYFYYFLIAKRLFRDLRISFRYVDWSIARQMFSYSGWAFMVQMADQLRFRLDAMVIASLMSAAAVTIYSVGLRLVESFADLVNRATNMMIPVFAQYSELRQEDQIREKLLFMTRINVVLAMFGGGVIVIVGKPFILRWMGPAFSSSYPVLVVLMVAMVAELTGYHANNVFYAVSKHKYLAIVNAVEGGANLILSIALARPLGLVGVAVGTAIPLLICRLIVVPRLLDRVLNLPPWQYYRNMLPAAVFTASYLSLYAVVAAPLLTPPTYQGVLVAALLACPLYSVVIPFVALRREERTALMGMFARGKPEVLPL